MTSLLLPLSKRYLILSNIPLLITQRYKYNVTVASESQNKTKSDNTILKKIAVSYSELLKKPSKKYKLGLGGALLYENIVDKLNYNKFFEEFQMDDTFLSWFVVTEIHVWILSLRIMQEERDGPTLRNYLIEAMWNDVKIRAKKLGILSSSLMNSQLALLSEQFNASLVGYDEAILSSDKLLANHLWRRFFNCKNDNPLQLERLVKYTRKQVNSLSNVPATDIFTLSPSINWVNL